jgi:hypothetical protein
MNVNRGSAHGSCAGRLAVEFGVYFVFDGEGSEVESFGVSNRLMLPLPTFCTLSKHEASIDSQTCILTVYTTLAFAQKHRKLDCTFVIAALRPTFRRVWWVSERMNPLEDSERDTSFDYCLLRRLMLHLYNCSKSFRRHAIFRYKLAQWSLGQPQIHHYVAILSAH